MQGEVFLCSICGENVNFDLAGWFRLSFTPFYGIMAAIVYPGIFGRMDVIYLNKKTLIILLVAVLALAGIICAVLLGGNTAPAAAPVVSADAVITDIPADSGAEDTREAALSSCNITLNGDSVTIDGAGAKANGSIVTITQNGDFYLSGKLDDGQIIVDAAKEDDDVRLHLNGVDITCASSAPIYVVQAGQVFIQPEAGTENFIADTENYVFAQGEDEPDAAIFSKDDLFFDGEGTLTVTGNYSMAIHGKDDVFFDGTGNYTLTSVGDGLKGKDTVRLSGGHLTITAGEDGIQSNNAKDEGMGNVYVGNTTLNITAGKHGIAAESLMNVHSGNITIQAEEDGLHCTNTVLLAQQEADTVSADGMLELTIDVQQDGVQAGTELTIGGGEIDITTAGGAENAPEHTEQFGFPGWFDTQTTEETVSAKGLKSDGDITVSGGSIQINSMDDALHCVGTLTVSDTADLKIDTGDDGLHSDDTLSIEGGNIHITQCYEGLEAVFINISGGDTTLVASDDGLNAAGGTTADTDFAFRGPPMEGIAETLEEATYYVHITGGKLTVDASGDGLDSNGALFIDGGEIYVSGPDGSMNGGLDYTTTGQINGGSVVVTEITSMAQNFDTSSTQPSFRYAFSTTFDNGSSVTLTDKDGTVLVDITAAKRFNSVTISLPELTVGETYTLTCDTETVEVEITDTIATQGAGGFGFGGPGGGPGGGGPGGGPGGPPPM